MILYVQGLTHCSGDIVWGGRNLSESGDLDSVERRGGGRMTSERWRGSGDGRWGGDWGRCPLVAHMG